MGAVCIYYHSVPISILRLLNPWAGHQMTFLPPWHISSSWPLSYSSPLSQYCGRHQYAMPTPLIPSPSEAQYQLAHTNDNRTNQILVSHYICLPLATIAVILRLVSRHLCRAARLQTDDYMVIAAWVYLSPLTSSIKSPFGVRRGHWIASMAYQATICRGRWLDLLDRFLRRRRSLLGCYVNPLRPTLTIRSKRSQKIRCPLRRRQTRSPLESPPDVRKGATYNIHLPVIKILKASYLTRSSSHT